MSDTFHGVPEVYTIEFCIALAKRYYSSYPFANDEVRAQEVASLARAMYKRESIDD